MATKNIVTQYRVFLVKKYQTGKRSIFQSKNQINKHLQK